MESCNAGDADECKSGEAKIRKKKENIMLQSLLLERVVRYLLLKLDRCGINSNASKEEWFETHKCIIGELQEGIQSTKVSKLHKLTSLFLPALLLC